MTNFIPIFPLGIVVYPGEQLNLHIFEPRYKQLITECFAEQKPFGIPTALDNSLADLGTLVEITEIVEVYEDGKMDIKTKGLKIFQVLEIIPTIPNKLYSGAIVSYPANSQQQQPYQMQQLLPAVYELHQLLNVTKDFKKPTAELLSYDIAHHLGLTLQEEYAVLALWREDQRIEYLKRHLQKVIPVVAGMESLKEKIKLNGHFKAFEGFNLDI
jgi:Lon protease-like protein